MGPTRSISGLLLILADLGVYWKFARQTALHVDVEEEGYLIYAVMRRSCAAPYYIGTRSHPGRRSFTEVESSSSTTPVNLSTVTNLGLKRLVAGDHHILASEGTMLSEMRKSCFNVQRVAEHGLSRLPYDASFCFIGKDNRSPVI